MSPRSGGMPGGGGIPGGGIPWDGSPNRQPPIQQGFRRLSADSESPTKDSNPIKGLGAENSGYSTYQSTEEYLGQNGKAANRIRKGINRLRLERQQRRIAELSQSIREQKESESLLRKAEINGSMEKAGEFQKAALRNAGNSLRAARSALLQGRIGHEQLSQEQVEAAIIALQETAWWDELLASRQVVRDELAHAAAYDLAQHIKTLKSGNISSDSLSRLVSDIDFLRIRIDLAAHQEGLLSPGVVRQYLSAASSVASQVMVGLIATSATAEATGVKVVPEVIYSAIGLTIGTSITEIYRRTSHGLKLRTVTAQLSECHYELVAAIEDLSELMSWSTKADLSSSDELKAIRSACLAGSFLASHVEQLALSFTWQGRGEYRETLHRIRKKLAQVRDLVIEQRYQDFSEARENLNNTNICLKEFSRSVDALGSDHV